MRKKESFENKIEHVQKLLEKLSDPEISLEESLKCYQDGMNNLKEAQKMLEEARLIYKELEFQGEAYKEEEA